MKHIGQLLKKCGNPLFFVRVSGESGWPTLVSGRRYLATSLRVPRVGNWIVFPNPVRRNEIFVKRVAKIDGPNYFVESSVSWGSSSADFGVIDNSFIIGTLIGI